MLNCLLIFYRYNYTCIFNGYRLVTIDFGHFCSREVCGHVTRENDTYGAYKMHSFVNCDSVQPQWRHYVVIRNIKIGKSLLNLSKIVIISIIYWCIWLLLIAYLLPILIYRYQFSFCSIWNCHLHMFLKFYDFIEVEQSNFYHSWVPHRTNTPDNKCKLASLHFRKS